MLEAFLAKRIGNDAVRQACFENRNNKNAKNCLGKFKGPKNGKALFEITSLNENNEAIVSTLELDSQTHAFYLFTEGDRIQFESCKANPTVVRILPTLKWAPVKGC